MPSKRKRASSRRPMGVAPSAASTARFRTSDGDYVAFDAADATPAGAHDDAAGLFGSVAGEEDDASGEEDDLDDDLDDDDDEDELDDDDLDDESEEDDDDEPEEDELAAGDEVGGELHRWGSRQLYGGDTADLEIGQDVADAEEEEALADVLRRRQLEALDASDFALDGAADDDENAGPGPEAVTGGEGGLFGAMVAALDGGGGAAAAAKTTSHGGTPRTPTTTNPRASSRRRTPEAENGSSAELAARLGAAARELARLRPRIRAVAGPPMDDDADDARAARRAAARVVLAAKEQLLLALCANLGFARLVAAEGEDPAQHPVVARLASLEARLKALDTPGRLVEGAIDDSAGAAALTNGARRDPEEERSAKKKKKKLQKSEPRDAMAQRRGLLPPAARRNASDAEAEEDRALEALPALGGATAVDPRLVRELRRRSRAAVAVETASGEADVGFFADRRSARDDDDEDDEEDERPAEEEDDAASEEEDGVASEEEEDAAGIDDDEARFLRLYEAHAAAVEKKKADKSKKYAVAPRYGDWTADRPSGAKLPGAQDGRRAATKEIVENRGLAPHKPRKNRNPRVKKRAKFNKAVIRRRGQVRDTVAYGTDKVNYGGETTGIRAKVSRSRRVMGGGT